MDSRLLFALLLICLTATTLSFSEQISLSPLKEEAPRLSLLSTTSLSVPTAPISSLIFCWRSSRTVLTPLLISSSFPTATPKFYPTAPSPVRLLRQNATKFLLDDVYRNPGPLQYDGPGADAKALSLCVEDQNYMGRIKKLQEYLDKVRTIMKPGCSQDVLKVALSSMASVTEVLSVMSPASNGGTQE